MLQKFGIQTLNVKAFTMQRLIGFGLCQKNIVADTLSAQVQYN